MLSQLESGTLPVWRARALDRATGLARDRSNGVLSRLVGAARDLAAEHGGPSFTVEQVVTRAGTSLKSFYRHFSGKDDLLLALFEEDNRRGALALEAMTAGAEDPLERLRRGVVGLFSVVASTEDRAYMAVLVREHLRLAESRPDGLREALAPYVDLLAAELEAAMGAGAVRPGDPRRDAVAVFHLVVGHLHALLLGQVEDDPTGLGEYLWEFCRGALSP
jgi:AcrR family transcriptional regulator